MAQIIVHVLVPILLVLLAGVGGAPPGIAKNPSQARCEIKKYKHCYNLEHVCPKFCPDGCTVECASCKPICVGGAKTPPDNSPTPSTPDYPKPSPSTPSIPDQNPPPSSSTLPPSLPTPTSEYPPPSTHLPKNPPPSSTPQPSPPTPSTPEINPPPSTPSPKNSPPPSFSTPPPSPPVPSENPPPTTSTPPSSHTPSPSTPSSKPPSTSPSSPSIPSPSTPSPTPYSAKKARCKNKKYPKCYNMEHVFPDACHGGCEVDCTTCKPVCKCDRPGVVCQDPRFIGGGKEFETTSLFNPDCSVGRFVGYNNENNDEVALMEMMPIA